MNCMRKGRKITKLIEVKKNAGTVENEMMEVMANMSSKSLIRLFLPLT